MYKFFPGDAFIFIVRENPRTDRRRKTQRAGETIKGEREAVAEGHREIETERGGRVVAELTSRSSEGRSGAGGGGGNGGRR